MSRWTATTRGTLRQRHRCQRIGESMWAWSQTWGLFTLCWGLYITGTCAIRIQCFGNTRTTWGNGNLLASFRTWIMTPVKLEYALQACYCTEVMLENVNAIQDKLGGIRWYIPLYRMYLYMKHIDIKIQPWGWCSSFFFFPPEKTVGNIDLKSKQKRRHILPPTWNNFQTSSRKMDLLFYFVTVKANVFRICSYLLFIRSFRKWKTRHSRLWRVCKYV